MKRLHYGWIFVILGALIVSTNALGVYGFGVFLAPLTEEFGWERGVLSGAMGVGMFLQGVLGLASGKLTDRFGPRVLVSFAGVLLGTGFLLMSRVTELWQVYIVWGISLGGEMGFTLVPLNSTIPRWFKKYRGIALGIPSAGFGIGAVISPILIQKLIIAYDWRTCFIIMGIVTYAITLPLAQFLKQDPEQMGLKPIGADEAQKSVPARKTELKGIPYSRAIKTKEYWVFGGVQFGFMICMQGIVTHLVPYAKDIGIPAIAAAAALSMLAAGSIFGRLLSGFISDRLNCFRTISMSLVLMTGMLVWLMFAQQAWMIYIFAVFFGLSYGAFIATLAMVPAELFGLRYLGTIYGSLMLIGSCGSSLGAPLGGRIYDLTGSYTIAFPVYVCVCSVSLILSLLLLRRRQKESAAPSGAADNLVLH